MIKYLNWALKFVHMELRKKGIREPTLDMGQTFTEIFEKTKDFSMTSPARLYATYQAVAYALKTGIEGAFVECGVWRGGNGMVMAMTAKGMGDTSRDIFLYDTYEGMASPSEEDVDLKGRHAFGRWRRNQRAQVNHWCYAPLDEVKNNMSKTGYPPERIRFVKGKVQDTVPEVSPEKIAVLRLDTDWYESTLHEMNHLFPQLVSGGVLLVDDYGFWHGQKKAIDRYFQEHKLTGILHRVDYSGRLFIKP